MTIPVIAARGLGVGHGARPFVTGLDLEVHPGEIVALLGANGAGKSTTLLGLAGALAAQEGHVELRGRTVRSALHRRAQQGLGFITQQRCVFMGLTARDNLRAGGVDPGRAVEAFPELRPHLGRTVGLLSGGQQQMLAVARAIARKPDVLLADELSLGLAPLVVDRILGALRTACIEDGLGLLLVEQQVPKALAVADRVVVLRRGKIALEGPVADVRGRLDDLQDLYL
ncbi:ATP-binding cassette domain-containing protein [Pseudonocardia sp. NPDC049154]|uniref:ABC transporter ATP-binding protein n=1 Tax=Pseudonocardia sp. NPDC049154 TaxID=3155501 RepID=UPI0033F26FB9